MSSIESNYPWICKEFFERIIRKDYPKHKVVIKDYTVKPALSHGENYTSQMIRATVFYTLDGGQNQFEIRLIIKAALSNIQLKEMLDELRIFEREIVAYKDVIPAVEKLLTDIGDDTKLSAKCYEANLEKTYLVFEDLSVRGYKNCDRRKGLDVAHFKLIFTKIAKYHAATAVLETKNFPSLNDFQKPNITSDSETWKSIITNAIKTLCEFTKMQPCFFHLQHKMPKMVEILFQKSCEAYVRDSDDFNALLHGDLWSNNIMFSYHDSCIPTDAIMVDYQLGYYGPPGLDLSYTLFTSSNEDLRDKDWDYLLQHYYSTLKATLLKLNYSKRLPTLTEIHLQFLRRGMSSAAIGLLLLGVRKLEDVPEDNMKNFLSESKESQKYRLDMFLNPKNRKGLEFLMNYFDRKGYFD